MNSLSEFIQGVLRTGIRLLLVLAAMVFVLSVLVAAVIVMLGVGIWSLLTGRRPQPVKVFSEFRRASSRFTPGGWPGARSGSPGQSDAMVVDVQAHEVPEHGAGAKPPPSSDQASR